MYVCISLVFLLSIICLHLCVNYFSMCLLKVFLNEKWNIQEKGAAWPENVLLCLFLNFFIHTSSSMMIISTLRSPVHMLGIFSCTTKYIELAPLSLTRALFVHFFMAGIIALHLTTAIKSSFFRTVFEMCFTFFSE